MLLSTGGIGWNKHWRIGMIKEFLFVALAGWVLYCVVLAYSLPGKAVDCEYASFHPDYSNNVRDECRERGQK